MSWFVSGILYLIGIWLTMFLLWYREEKLKRVKKRLGLHYDYDIEHKIGWAVFWPVTLYVLSIKMAVERMFDNDQNT